MGQVQRRAYAKINLSIDVSGKRPDGYHEVIMVMQQVALWDQITVSSEKGGGNISITANRPWLPVDRRNIAYKAVELMRETFRPAGNPDVTVEIRKHIPVAAGLGGGSADGAAALHALNSLWELGLSTEELMVLGLQLGADVPFCLMGQDAALATCALATGIGEKLEPLPALDAWVLLSKPPISVSTAKVYGHLDLNQIQERPDTEEILRGLQEGNSQLVMENLCNVLETVTLKRFPRIADTRDRMYGPGPGERALMSGSGPTVFRLFSSQEEGQALYETMKTVNRETYLVKTLK